MQPARHTRQSSKKVASANGETEGMANQSADLFWQACGAAGPLRLEVTAGGRAEPERRLVHQPFAVLGRDAVCELPLAPPAPSFWKVARCSRPVPAPPPPRSPTMTLFEPSMSFIEPPHDCAGSIMRKAALPLTKTWGAPCVAVHMF